MAFQTTIQGDQLNPPQLDGISCEWCREPAVGSLPILCRVPGKRGARTPSGMRVYFCANCKEKAKRFTAEPLR